MSILLGSVDDDASSSNESTSSSKRRRLTPAERIAELLEEERKERMQEKRYNYDSITSASTATQNAVTALKLLKEISVSDEIVREAEKSECLGSTLDARNGPEV
ncbi:unnamed protein product [Phytophthora fragariaefolia]|uniref:Unnamed protein product n=1 Tax=Phytophthora fragariaefolia TaxID=1490495 RepID=A0A9W7CLK2_9STRA|nr:unnamed protein product [Phytophthora fragariaefolia]